MRQQRSPTLAMFQHKEFDANNKACHSELFDSALRVRYRVGGRDERLLLNVKLTTLLKFGLGDEKLMKVVVTDDDNPLLLFSTEVDGDAYAKLRHKLGLLIDFAQFPHQLASLLQQCAGPEAAAACKYELLLEESAADPYDLVEGQCVLLRIVESNDFQRLCLVALHMACGSEAEVNAFMARNLQLARQRCEQLTAQLAEAHRRRAAAEEAASAKGVDVERARLQAGDQLKAMRHAHEDELATARRENERLRAEHERRVQEALDEAEERHRGAGAKLEATVARLTAELAAAKATTVRVEQELAHKGDAQNKLVDDLKMLQDELLRSEQKTQRLENEAKERNVFVVSLKQRVAQLEREKDEKSKAIKKLSQLLDASDSAKTQLKTMLKEKLELVDALKESAALLTKDLTKANEIIAKLTKENKLVAQKLGERTKIALHQEKVIAACQQNFERSQRIVDERTAQIRQLEAEMETLRGGLKRCEESCLQKDEQIRKNERIIGWLNDIVSKQGTPASSYAASRLSTAAGSNSQLSVPEGSLDKKLMQLTVNGAEAAKSNSSAAARKANRNFSMRGK